jgi:hypothetical protein
MDNEKFNKKSYEKFLEWIKKQEYENFFIFVLGNVSSDKEKIIEFFNNLPKNSFKIFVKNGNDDNIKAADMIVNSPCMLKIGEVKILILNLQSQPNLNSKEFFLETLKRRHFKLGLMDTFIIDTIPDLFVCSGLNEAIEFNYKGITFLSTGNFISQPIFWMINLASRETIKIDFS